MTGAMLVEADDVAAVYPGASAPAVSSLTFGVRAGQRIAVLGPNGGGKTTLLRLLTGELRPASGRLTVPGGRVALVPQDDHSRLDFPVSAADVALMGAVSRTAWWRRPSRSDRELAREALARVGLAEHADSTFGELSGGQRRRALVARALVQDAPLLLLDEPYAGLDASSSALLDALLAQLAAEGRGLLISTHDLEQARASDLVLCLNRVQVAFGPPAQALRLEVIERTYGAALVPLVEGGRAAPAADHQGEPER